jgi:hypothetical protein
MLNIIPKIKLMNKGVKLITFLLFVSHVSFGQFESQRSPTKFDKFITRKSIQWAAYLPATLQFENYNLSAELYERFQNGKIRITEPLYRDSLMAGTPIVYIDKQELEKKSFPPGLFPGHSSSQKPTNRVDSNSSMKIDVQEILYVMDGKLYSYIPWVSTKISVYTSSDRYLGTTDYFSSCVNTRYNFKPSKRDKLVFLKSTIKKLLIDTIPRTDMLKQLYGINILEAIWNDIINDKNEIFDIRSGQKKSPKDLKQFVYSNMISIPVYDSLGNITGYTNYVKPASPSFFQQVEITEDWFYDQTKNVLISRIPAITLFAVSKNDNDDGQLKPVLKITFK